MLKILGLIVLAIVVIVVAIVAYASTRPSSMRISRTVLIAAPAEQIFPLIDSPRAWRGWSPYEDKDPGMKRVYGGPAAGVGATYAWDGNPKTIGSGAMAVIQSEPSSKVVFDLRFITPFKARNTGVFTLAPEAGSTRVTWTMEGPSPLVSRVMGLFMDMDAMIGGDFDVGLARLKAKVEG